MSLASVMFIFIENDPKYEFNYINSVAKRQISFNMSEICLHTKYGGIVVYLPIHIQIQTSIHLHVNQTILQHWYTQNISAQLNMHRYIAKHFTTDLVCDAYIRRPYTKIWCLAGKCSRCFLKFSSKIGEWTEWIDWKFCNKDGQNNCSSFWKLFV